MAIPVLALGRPDRRALWVLPTLFLLAGCGSDSDSPTDPDPTPADRVPSAIEIQGAAIAVDDGATTRISATVRDQDGVAFTALPTGVSVTWSVQDGQVASVQPVGAGLQADVSGQRPGSTQIQAAVANANASVDLTVRQVATELAYVSGNEQEGPGGGALDEPLVVKVSDRHGDGVQGVNVEFHVLAGGGTVSAASVASDADGLASVQWSLGTAAPDQQLEARVAGLSGSPITFWATAEIETATGTVTGTVTAANGVTPIQGARVRLQTDGAAVAPGATARSEGPEALTDAEGRYVLEDVPPGEQTLVATRGVFRVEIQVQVLAGELVEAPLAALDAEGLAYVDGMFDSIEEIIRDELGTEVTRIEPLDLASPEVTSQFRFIFINCGVDDWEYQEDPDVLANLRDFIAAGGSVYVSDLELPLVQNLFPDQVLQIDESGDEQTVPGEVVSSSLREFLGGKSSVDIVFNLDDWAHITALSGDPEVLVQGNFTTYEGPVGGGPLAIAIQHGDGHLVYTSFHTNAAATDDQLSVLRYFIFHFGQPEGIAAVEFASPVSVESSGLTFRDYAVPHRGHHHRRPR